MLIGEGLVAFMLAKDKGDFGGVVFFPFLVALAYLGLRRMMRDVRTVEVSDTALKLRFWLRRPVEVPWSQVITAERPPRQKGLGGTRLSVWRIHVSPAYGGYFAVDEGMRDLGELCDQINARARGAIPTERKVFAYRLWWRVAWSMALLSVPLWVIATTHMAVKVSSMTGQVRAWFSILWVIGWLVVLAHVARGSPAAIEVSEGGLRLHFWLRFRRPLDVPWSHVVRPESYPPVTKLLGLFLWRHNSGCIYVLPPYGRRFWVSLPQFPDLGGLYDEISARARG